MSVSTSYIYKGKVKDPRYMQHKKDSRISLEAGKSQRFLDFNFSQAFLLSFLKLIQNKIKYCCFIHAKLELGKAHIMHTDILLKFKNEIYTSILIF